MDEVAYKIVQKWSGEPNIRCHITPTDKSWKLSNVLHYKRLKDKCSSRFWFSAKVL